MPALYNFSHPLTDANIIEINNLTSSFRDDLNVHFTRSDVVDIPVQINPTESIAPQSRKLIDDNINADECPRGRVYVRMPGHADLAATMAIMLNTRLYVNIIRLAPVPGAVPTTYKVVEVTEL